MKRITDICATISNLLVAELPNGTLSNVENACKSILQGLAASPTANSAADAKTAIHGQISLNASGSVADHVCNSIHNDLVQLFASLPVSPSEEPVLSTEDPEKSNDQPTAEELVPIEEPVVSDEPSAEIPGTEEIKSDAETLPSDSSPEGLPSESKSQKKSGNSGPSSSHRKGEVTEKTFAEVPMGDTFTLAKGQPAKFHKTSKGKAKCMNSKNPDFEKGEEYRFVAKVRVLH